MRGLNAVDILRVWDLCLDQHPLDRALTILATGCPELPYSDLVALPIGQRDTRLLTIYTLTFGGRIEARARCPSCQEQVEFGLNAADFLASPSETPQQGVLQSGEISVTFRPLNSLDLAAIATMPGVDPARLFLARRCVLSMTRDGAAIELDTLPDDVLSALADGLAMLDPQAAIELDLRCPACAARWQAVFDIVVQFWAELSTAARQLAFDVHRLAAAYGWREADILALSAARRRLYLEMIG